MEWVILNNLVEDHPYRNTPLIELNAEYVSRGSKIWYKVQPAFNISKKTFNELAYVWKNWDTWRIPVEDWDEERINVIGQNGNTGEHY